MTSTTHAASWPASLEFDPATDPARGRHLLLGAVWGARVHPQHDEAGELVDRDYFGLPKRDWLTSGDLPVNLDHNPRRKAGRIVDGATDETGVWLVVDLDDEGEAAIPDCRGVSLECVGLPGTKPKWIVSGVALVLSQDPAVPGSHVVFTTVSAGVAVSETEQLATAVPGSSRVVFTAASAGVAVTEPEQLAVWLGERGYLRRIARDADVSGGVVVRNGAKAKVNTPGHARGVVDLAEHRREAYAYSMQAVHDDTARHRRIFERRQEALRRAKLDDERNRLIAAQVPHSQWPLWSKERQGWDRRIAEQAANRAAVQARAEAEARGEAVRALQESWRRREAGQAQVAGEVKPSWLRRILGSLRRHG